MCRDVRLFCWFLIPHLTLSAFFGYTLLHSIHTFIETHCKRISQFNFQYLLYSLLKCKVLQIIIYRWNDLSVMFMINRLDSQNYFFWWVNLYAFYQLNYLYLWSSKFFFASLCVVFICLFFPNCCTLHLTNIRS